MEISFKKCCLQHFWKWIPINLFGKLPKLATNPKRKGKKKKKKKKKFSTSGFFLPFNQIWPLSMKFHEIHENSMDFPGNPEWSGNFTNGEISWEYFQEIPENPPIVREIQERKTGRSLAPNLCPALLGRATVQQQIWADLSENAGGSASENWQICRPADLPSFCWVNLPACRSGQICPAKLGRSVATSRSG